MLAARAQALAQGNTTKVALDREQQLTLIFQVTRSQSKQSTPGHIVHTDILFYQEDIYNALPGKLRLQLKPSHSFDCPNNGVHCIIEELLLHNS